MSEMKPGSRCPWSFAPCLRAPWARRRILPETDVNTVTRQSASPHASFRSISAGAWYIRVLRFPNADPERSAVERNVAFYREIPLPADRYLGHAGFPFHERALIRDEVDERRITFNLDANAVRRTETPIPTHLLDITD